MAMLLAIAACGIAFGQENSDCFACHEDASLTTERQGKAVSLYVDQAIFSKSVHADLSCVTCHIGLEGKEMPHEVPVAPVQCGTCHSSEEDLHKESLHGKAVARGDALAPNCQSCHGSHAIVPVKSRESAVAPVKVPFVCGRCHQEGTRV